MSIFKQFLISAYQFDRYKELISLKSGKVILYEVVLFLVTTLISIVPFIILFIGYGGTSGIINEFIPDFIIENGTLQAETIIITEGNSIVIIDGNNERSEFDFQGVENGVIFDKKKIIVNNGIESTHISYDDLLGSIGVDKFEKSDIFNYTSEINILFAVFFVITISALITSEAFGIIFLSLCALVINKFLKGGLNYNELFKISVYVRTPAVVLTALLSLFGMGLGFIFVVVLNLAYLFFSVKKCKKS